MVGGEEWQEKVYDREEWKKLLGTARNRHILHMAMKLFTNFSGPAVSSYASCPVVSYCGDGEARLSP
jgi:hypothetical protein